MTTEENLNGTEQSSVAGTPEQNPAVDAVTSTSTATTGNEVTDVQNAPSGDAPTNGSGDKPIDHVKNDGPFGKTELEKATYSFHKQLSKQRSKYEKQISEMAERLEKLEHPEKYRPKTRADFNGNGEDDAYVNYLVEEKTKALFNAQIAAWQKEKEEEDARNSVDAEYRARAEENIKKLYPTPEAEQNFRETVREAMDRGLGELLDQDESLSNYILLSPMGPSIMYKLASSKEAVAKLFEGARNSMDLQFRIRDLEREIIEENRAKAAQPNPAPAAQNQTPQAVKPVKPIGKPGISRSEKKDIFSDEKAMINYLRS